MLPGMMGILSACSVHQSPLQEIDPQQVAAETQARWQAHRLEMSKIDRWKVKGKIAVKAGSKGGHASLRWDRAAGEQHIELYGPLGGGRVVIDVDAQGAALKDTQGGLLAGKSVAGLIEQRLGWPLPFDQLPDWLRGLPASDQAQMQWDESGHVTRMDDQGWQVSYPEYQLLSNGASDATDVALSVPRIIELNALPGTLRVYDKAGEYLGEDFFIRLIIKSWRP